MAECEQGGQSQQEVIPPLSVYESTQVRSVNLNELIRIHRSKQRYQIWDKFFNNSYICIDNKVHPVEIYYQHDRFKSYLQDLNMVYFKDIEFNQHVRLQYIIRRLNFTLNGQSYDFTQFLKEHSCYDQIQNVFTEQYLQELEIRSNDKKVIHLRNSLFLSYLLYELATYHFTNDQSSLIIKEISMLYIDLKKKINYQNEAQEHSQLLSSHRFQCAVNSITNQSEKSPDRCDQEDQNDSHLIEYLKSNIENSKQQKHDQEPSQGINYFFDDLIYQEEISLKIIEIELQNYYFSNQLNDPNNSEELKFKLKYLSEINKEYIGKLKELRELNSRNRHILKKIQKNISIEFNAGRKCIVIDDSDDYRQCFGDPPRLESTMELRHSKYQKVTDSQAILHIVLKSIKMLKLKQIADAIQKVYQIERIQNNQSKNHGKLMFSVCFERGLGVKEANFCQKDFLMLNELREQSALTSYLTPMKSYYSYISHNIFTFLNIYQKQFPYDKEINNNEEVLKRIKNKISRHRNLGKAEIKDFYYDNFKICHNCKILCQKSFLKQCKRRVKHQKFSSADDQEEVDDDSLYTERDGKNRKHSGLYIVECEKSYCIYCINNQFNGKLFNEKGWCPSCLDMCPCNTCLRAKMIKKLVELYIFTGGDIRNIKSEKEIIEGLRISRSNEKDHSQESDEDSFFMTQADDKIYQDVIKRQIMKGYSAEQVEISLRQQQEIIGMIIDRQSIKLEDHLVQNAIFRNKVMMLYGSFEAIDQEIEQEKQVTQKEKEFKIEREKQEMKNRKRERKDTGKSSERRKCRKLIRDEEIYYDYFKLDISDSSDEQSSFHISKQRSRADRKKCKEYKYEPEYTF